MINVANQPIEVAVTERSCLANDTISRWANLNRPLWLTRTLGLTTNFVASTSVNSATSCPPSDEQLFVLKFYAHTRGIGL